MSSMHEAVDLGGGPSPWSTMHEGGRVSNLGGTGGAMCKMFELALEQRVYLEKVEGLNRKTCFSHITGAFLFLPAHHSQAWELGPEWRKGNGMTDD